MEISQHMEKALPRSGQMGKDFLSDDVKTATEELPANIVDLVQVIDE